MRDIVELARDYASACANTERYRVLAGHLTGTAAEDAAARAAEYDQTVVVGHARLMTAADQLTHTTIRAIADERLPVCTWQKGVIEARGVLPDRARSVRIRYSPAQAVAAGAALIACAALADAGTGGTLTPILPPFSPDTSTSSSAAGAPLDPSESA